MPIINEMVKYLEVSVGLSEQDEYFDYIITNKTIELKEKITCISFSGGVADYIYNEHSCDDYFKYGDVGILLGEAIKNSRLCRDLRLLKSLETIRATVVGAGSHTTEISGSTITYTQDSFPMKNLPIIKLSLEEEAQEVEEFKNAIKEKLQWFKLENDLQKSCIRT